MRRALIVYATSYGHTAKIVKRVAELLAQSFAVDAVEFKRFKRPPELDGYALVVAAGSIHFGRHQRRLERFIRGHVAALHAVDNALISVSGSAIDADSRGDAEGYVAELTRLTGWAPRRVLLAGGATSYTRYGFFLKRTVRKASAASGRGTDIRRDYDYTNWAEVEGFARTLAR